MNQVASSYDFASRKPPHDQTVAALCDRVRQQHADERGWTEVDDLELVISVQRKPSSIRMWLTLNCDGTERDFDLATPTHPLVPEAVLPLAGAERLPLRPDEQALLTRLAVAAVVQDLSQVESAQAALALFLAKSESPERTTIEATSPTLRPRAASPVSPDARATDHRSTPGAR